MWGLEKCIKKGGGRNQRNKRFDLIIDPFDGAKPQPSGRGVERLTFPYGFAIFYKKQGEIPHL